MSGGEAKKIRNPKLEIRNKFKNPIRNVRNVAGSDAISSPLILTPYFSPRLSSRASEFGFPEALMLLRSFLLAAARVGTLFLLAGTGIAGLVGGLFHGLLRGLFGGLFGGLLCRLVRCLVCGGCLLIG